MDEGKLRQQIAQLQQAISALEAQRVLLGDSVVDAALNSIRERLATLETQAAPNIPINKEESPTAAATLSPDSSQRPQQRKLITVLVVDISRFTSISEKMDAEDVTNFVNTLWKRLDSIIVSHGGIIEKHIGDAIQALWGVSTAREDDAERAIRAALSMQAEIPIFHAQAQQNHSAALASVELRIGINTGPVLLSEVGSKHEYTAVGDTVILAESLQHAAPIGGILISHDTYRHVEGLFDVQPQPPLQLENKKTSLRVYVVERARPHAFRSGTRGVEGVETHMVGRNAEMQRLQEAFFTANRQNKLQIVTIIGEAGIGKSRLLHEFDRWSEQNGEDFVYFKGRARQESQRLPYAVLRDLFAFRFSILDNDTLQTVWKKWEYGIGNSRQAHFIGQLLGYDFSSSPYLTDVLGKDERAADPRQLHDRALSYIYSYIKNITSKSPALILLEDLHWADDSSLEILAHLSERLENQPLLAVCTARPTLFERRPSWGQDYSVHIRLELSPLTRQESSQLVEEILQKVENIPDLLRETVISKAEGNPFYMEELIKMLIEDGVILHEADRWQINPSRMASVRLPSTLAAVLQARFDRLPLQERQYLQRASVIGRTFWDDAVTFLGKEAASSQYENAPSSPLNTESADESSNLMALQDRELIFQRDGSTFAGSREYIFKHALLHESTYESVLKRERRIYHIRAARWIEYHSGGRADELTGVIAEHLALAGQTAEAADYLLRAGQQAILRFANTEAINDFSRAVELLSKQNRIGYNNATLDILYTILLAREKVYDLLGQRHAQRKDLVSLEEIVQQPKIPPAQDQQAEISLRWANYANAIGDYAAAIHHAQNAIQLTQQAQQSGHAGPANTAHEANGYLLWGTVLRRQTNYPEARQLLNQALFLARSAGLRPIEADSLRGLGTICWYLGDFPGARRFYEQSLQICQTMKDLKAEGRTLNNLGLVAYEQGDYALAQDYYEQSLQISRETGDRPGEGIKFNNLGTLYSALGDYARARSSYEAYLEICQEVGDRQGEGLALSNIGEICWRQNDYSTAMSCLEKARQMFIEADNTSGMGFTLIDLAHTLMSSGRLDEAEQTYQQVLQVSRNLEQNYLVMEILAGLLRVERSRGEIDAARQYLQEILAYLKAGGSLEGAEQPFWIYLTCYQMLQAEKDPRANEILTTAYEQLQTRAGRISNEAMRHSYLENVPEHHELIRAWQSMQNKNYPD